MNHSKYSVVISCGGLGSRLKKITKDIPKPLYPILGKSTFERTLRELKTYELKKILVTVGYQSEEFVKSIEYLAKKYDLKIDVFIEIDPLGECGALWKVKDKLSKDIIFINGDLIFSLDFNRLINFHERLSSNLTLVTHTSDHPEDSDLVSTPNGTLIEKIYLKNERKKSYKNAYLGNTGICVMKRNLLEKILPPNQNDSKSIFHFIVKNIFDLNLNIFSYNTSEYIKDMGTPKRLEIVEKDLILNKVNSKNYLNKQKALFLDRDNTLIECAIGDYIIDKDNIKYLENNIGKICSIATEFDLVCLVTNQPVIAMGKITLEELEEINTLIVKYILKKGLKIDVVTFCPHHPHKGFNKEIPMLKKDCFCRKPNPGLLIEQSFIRNIDLSKSLMIGDSECDFLAAKNAGCEFLNIDNL